MKKLLFCTLALSIIACGNTETKTDDDKTGDSITDKINCAENNYQDCFTDAGHEYAYQCTSGKVSKTLACAENEYCGVSAQVGAYCDFKLPEGADKYCQGREDSSFCQKIGNDTWMLVCSTNGKIITGDFATTNCTGYGVLCEERTDDYGTYALCVRPNQENN